MQTKRQLVPAGERHVLAAVEHDVPAENTAAAPVESERIAELVAIAAVRAVVLPKRRVPSEARLYEGDLVLDRRKGQLAVLVEERVVLLLVDIADCTFDAIVERKRVRRKQCEPSLTGEPLALDVVLGGSRVDVVGTVVENAHAPLNTLRKIHIGQVEVREAAF